VTTSADSAQAAQAPAAGTGQERAPDRAGKIFRLLTVVPALLAMAWIIAGLPLLLIGQFAPLPMLVISLPLAALLMKLALRWVPGEPQNLLAARDAAPARTPWWAVAALIAVAIAFGVDQFAYHSQQIIVQRDPGSYIQFGNWIARHGSLPIPQRASAFGGYRDGLSFNTAAFYQVGRSIVPQFMAGLPMVLAATFWIGGVKAAVATGALLGSCGVLALGGLTGRLIGPRWAPLGALILALSLPEQFTSRSTYSEPLCQVLFLGGLCLVVDSCTATEAGKKKLAALAGLAIGLTVLVRIDGISDILPLIPYCGLLVLQRRPQAWPMIAGVIAGTAFGATDGVILSNPYLTEISGSLWPVLTAAGLLLVATVIAVLLLWRRGPPEPLTGWLPNAVAVLPILVTIGFVIRPYLQTVHGQKTQAEAASMARIQAATHLPIQPYRLYYEISLRWVFWYLGIPVVVLAAIGAAALARRCLRGQAPAWTLPLISFSWIIVATLLRPSIVPDQPWASRRLVPAVLPGFVALALWAASWLLAWLRQRGTSRVPRGAVFAVLAVALVAPAAVTTFGLAIRDNGGHGFRVAASGMWDKATFRGEIAAVHNVCSAIPPNSSVVFVSAGAGGQLAQAVRGMCGEPAAVVVRPGRNQMKILVADIQRAGRRPILVGKWPSLLRRYGFHPRQIVQLRSRGDEHTLVTPPERTEPLVINIWIAEISS